MSVKCTPDSESLTVRNWLGLIISEDHEFRLAALFLPVEHFCRHRAPKKRPVVNACNSSVGLTRFEQ